MCVFTYSSRSRCVLYLMILLWSVSLFVTHAGETVGTVEEEGSFTFLGGTNTTTDDDGTGCGSSADHSGDDEESLETVRLNAYTVCASIIFALSSYTFLFPCNSLIPLDRRTVAVVGSVLCYLTRAFAFGGDRPINVQEAVDFEVLILLPSIMVVNHVVVHLKETRKVIDYLQSTVQNHPRKGFWLVSLSAFLASPFLTNDGVCLLFVEPILHAFDATLSDSTSAALTPRRSQEESHLVADSGGVMDQSEEVLAPELRSGSGSENGRGGQNHPSFRSSSNTVDTLNFSGIIKLSHGPSELRKTDAIYFLLALACSSNIGSALTYTGNPQNMIVASDAVGVLPPYKFLLYMIGPAVLSWLVTIGWIERCWFKQRNVTDGITINGTRDDSASSFMKTALLLGLNTTAHLNSSDAEMGVEVGSFSIEDGGCQLLTTGCEEAQSQSSSSSSQLPVNRTTRTGALTRDGGVNSSVNNGYIDGSTDSGLVEGRHSRSASIIRMEEGGGGGGGGGGIRSRAGSLISDAVKSIVGDTTGGDHSPFSGTPFRSRSNSVDEASSRSRAVSIISNAVISVLAPDSIATSAADDNTTYQYIAATNHDEAAHIEDITDTSTAIPGTAGATLMSTAPGMGGMNGRVEVEGRGGAAALASIPEFMELPLQPDDVNALKENPIHCSNNLERDRESGGSNSNGEDEDEDEDEDGKSSAASSYFMVASPAPYAVLVLLFAMVVMIFVDVMAISTLICISAVVIVVFVAMGNHWRDRKVWKERVPEEPWSMVQKGRGVDESKNKNKKKFQFSGGISKEERQRSLNDFFDGLFNSIDYSLLLIFLGIFVIVENIASTGIPRALWSSIVGKKPFMTVQSILGISCFVVVVSQLLGNVAVIQLAKPNVHDLSDDTKRLAWAVLSFVATVGGNLTITGSAANIIVAEKARKLDSSLNIDFFVHYKVCFWVTVFSCVVGGALVSLAAVVDSS